MLEEGQLSMKPMEYGFPVCSDRMSGLQIDKAPPHPLVSIIPITSGPSPTCCYPVLTGFGMALLLSGRFPLYLVECDCIMGKSHSSLGNSVTDHNEDDLYWVRKLRDVRLTDENKEVSCIIDTCFLLWKTV